MKINENLYNPLKASDPCKIQVFKFDGVVKSPTYCI
jgi:hypothetical protein